MHLSHSQCLFFFTFISLLLQLSYLLVNLRTIHPAFSLPMQFFHFSVHSNFPCSFLTFLATFSLFVHFSYYSTQLSYSPCNFFIVRSFFALFCSAFSLSMQLSHFSCNSRIVRSFFPFVIQLSHFPFSILNFLVTFSLFFQFPHSSYSFHAFLIDMMSRQDRSEFIKAAVYLRELSCHPSRDTMTDRLLTMQEMWEPCTKSVEKVRKQDRERESYM